jgi:hypothetical protein
VSYILQALLRHVGLGDVVHDIHLCGSRYPLQEERKTGRKTGRKEGRKDGRQAGRNEGRRDGSSRETARLREREGRVGERKRGRQEEKRKGGKEDWPCTLYTGSI